MDGDSLPVSTGPSRARCAHPGFLTCSERELEVEVVERDKTRDAAGHEIAFRRLCELHFLYLHLYYIVRMPLVSTALSAHSPGSCRHPGAQSRQGTPCRAHTQVR